MFAGPVAGTRVGRRRRRPALPGWPFLLVGLGMIWGLSFLFIKVADESLAPVQVALGRMVFGTLTVLAVAALRRLPLPRGVTTWGHLAVAGLLANALPFTLFAYGEQRVTAVLAGIWNATTPLVALPVAMLLLPGERASRRRLAGLAVGFGGVLVVLQAWRGLGGQNVAGDLMCLGAAACYGLAFPYVRRFLSGSGHPPLTLAAGQLVCGTVELAVVAPLVGGVPAGLPGRVVASVVVLGVLGTGVAYVMNYAVIRDAGATVASTVTYVIPVFSTLAGVLLLGEALSWDQPVGAAVIVLGAALTQARPGSRPPAGGSVPP